MSNDVSDSDLDKAASQAPAVNPKEPLAFAGWMLFFGVVLPCAVIAFEVATRVCAEALFDPMPTLAHIPLTLIVPAVNFWLWRTLRRDPPVSRWLPVAGGAALAISLFYAFWFLPLAPFALIGVIFFGIGFLPLAPILSFGVAARLVALSRSRFDLAFAKRVWAGVALGVVSIIALDVPSGATLLALRWSTEGNDSASKAVRLMRALGDREQLIRRSHNEQHNTIGPLSVVLGDSPNWFSLFGRKSLGIDREEARKLYFRVTGKSHESVSPRKQFWFGRDTNDFVFDEDQGGTEIGRRVAGLTLSSSRIEGTVRADEAVANLEWTMEFSNASRRAQEARLTLEMPSGAVASRATLWVSGEPREASVASRAATREAYEKVVKRERRDPLLVSTSGADRLLVQAFPIEPGKSLKLRVGFVSPMRFQSNGKPSIVLPAIVDRNFVIDSTLKHLLWIDSAPDLVANIDAITAQRTSAGVLQLKGELSDKQLLHHRPRLIAAAPSIAKSSVARIPETVLAHGGFVSQTISQQMPTMPQQLVIVLDGSEGARSIAPALQAEIERLPSAAIVGLIIAADPVVRINPLAASSEHKAQMLHALKSTHFRGGHDNAEALALALDWIGEKQQSVVMWIHSLQPYVFSPSSAQLQQRLERLDRLPQLMTYQATAGANKVVSDHHWFSRAQTFAAPNDGIGDLKELFASVYAIEVRWMVRRALTDTGNNDAIANDGTVARLWAAQHIAELVAQKPPNRDEALKLAMGFRLITPVSGAVVLETDAEYKKQGLPVPGLDGQAIPQPDSRQLLLIGAIVFAFTLRQRRNRLM